MEHQSLKVDCKVHSVSIWGRDKSKLSIFQRRIEWCKVWHNVIWQYKCMSINVMMCIFKLEASNANIIFNSYSILTNKIDIECVFTWRLFENIILNLMICKSYGEKTKSGFEFEQRTLRSNFELISSAIWANNICIMNVFSSYIS